MAPRERLRLLHTSDIHLGAEVRQQCGEHRAGCICPILALRDLVVEKGADALLIAGDLFDHGRIKPAMAQDVFEVLAGLDVPVALLPGNHDVHDDDGLYRRYRSHVDEAGVVLLDDAAGSGTTLLDGSLHLWGRAMDEHSPKFRPLDAPPERSTDEWYVVMAHGHYVAGGEKDPDWMIRSSPITPAHVDATGADYVALGHWHRLCPLAEACVPAWYAGTPSSTYAPGTAILVELEHGKPAAVEPLSVTAPAAGCAA
ncbi:MAG: exonuclease SbcCD subunit D, partial [Acidimicrobiales bacterium]